MAHLTLGDIAIRQHDGLYSINDLHVASGGEKRHQPSNFLRLEQTQALAAEIHSSDLRSALQVINGGKAPGTYVCRELVIAYATWISAAFHLKVIRVFLAATTPVGQEPPERLTPEQRREVDRWISVALAGLNGDCGGAQMHLHNRLRVLLDLATLDELRPCHLPAVRLECERVQTALRDGYFHIRSELREFVEQQLIGAGAPWTPSITRHWRAVIKAALPARPEWLVMKEQVRRLKGGDGA